MRTPSTTAPDFGSCRGATAGTRSAAFFLSVETHPARHLAALLCLLSVFACFLGGRLADSAGAAEHNVVTGEYGKEGPKASGIGNNCRIAFDEGLQRIYVLSDKKVYALDRTAPGVVSPAPGFPVEPPIPSTECWSSQIAADPVSGNIFPVAGSSTIHGLLPSGAPLAGLWPVTTAGTACGVAVTGSGEVWAGAYGNTGEVTKFSASGVPTGVKTFENNQCKIAVDRRTDDLFVLGLGTWQLTKYTAASGYTSTLKFGEMGSGIAGLAVNAALEKIYVADGSSNVVAYDTGTAAKVETIPVGGNAQDVAVDEEMDTLYVQVGSEGSGHIKEYLGVKYPKATTGPSVGNIGVTGTADPNGAGPIVACYFQYGLSAPGYGSKQPCAEALPITTAQPVSASLPDLLGEQTYHYRLVLETATPGIVGRGLDKTIVPHYVKDLETKPASNLTRTTATLNALFTGTSEDTDYYFDWGPMAPAYGQQTAPPPGESAGVTAGPTPLSFNLTGLTAGTTYHFRVVATNQQGTSPAQDVSFTTSPAIKQIKTNPPTDVDTDSATFHGEVDPDGFATTYYFQYGRGTGYGKTIPAPPGTDLGITAPGLTAVSTGVSGLLPNTEYHYRLVGVNSTGTTFAGDDQMFTTPQPPSVESFTTRRVTATSAELVARINPNGEDTTYHFEYGTTPAYGSRVPVPEGAMAAGVTPEEIIESVSGLEQRTYHFRVVATNEWGTTTTGNQTFSFYPPSCPNETLRQQTGASYLPDCRAYELVSPASPGNVILYPGGIPSATAISPSRFTFMGQLGTVKDSGDPLGIMSDLYIATRTASGWITKYVGLKGNEKLEVGGPPSIPFNTPGKPEGLANLSLDRVIDWDYGHSGYYCCGLEGSYAPHLFDADGTNLGRWPTNLAEVPHATDDVAENGFTGDIKPSADLEHYIFSSTSLAFAGDGVTTAPGSVYDNDIAERTVTVVSKTPAKVDIPRDAGSSAEFIRIPAVSQDGSHILMSTEATGGGVHLYMAVNQVVFYDISRGQDDLNHGVRFVGMDRDGGKVYFLSSEHLASTDTDSSTDLYMWDEASDQVLLLSGGANEGTSDSCASSWAAQCGVEVIAPEQGMSMDNFIAAESGDVYFYSPEQLAGGEGAPGERNLYLNSEGTVRFVATLPPGTPITRMRVNPTNSQMAFVTAAQLTAYENAGHTEMYTYTPDTGVIKCVSCIPSGVPPTDDVKGSRHGIFMADDGRTFFSTRDSLVDQDSNGLIDIYEFVENRPQLISSGTAPADYQNGYEVGLMGVSADGTDVYFSTVDSLVGQDTGGPFYKFYNARTAGGFPFVPKRAPCAAADECHGPSSEPAIPLARGTAESLGDGGNAKATKKKKKKRTQKKKKRRKQKAAGRAGQADGAGHGRG